MPRLPALRLLGIILLFGYLPSRAQYHLSGNLPSHSSYRDRYTDTAILRRWSLSFNPLGLMEDPSAVGLGGGYRFGHGFQLWQESSLLSGWSVTFPVGPLTGFRQIVRLSVFPSNAFAGNPNLFYAVELRYKTYSYPDTSDFQNLATGDEIKNVHFHSKHKVFGGAVQVGWLFPLSKDGHWLVEATIGLGGKYKQITREGSPSGYLYLQTGKSVDLNIRDLVETPGWEFYVPGSFRIIYAFGRRLR